MGQPEAVAAHFAYDRSPRNRAWLLAFAAMWAVCIAGAAYGWFHRNPAARLDLAGVPASQCPHEWLSPETRRRLLASFEGQARDDTRVFTAALAVSSAGSLLLGAAFLRVFQQHAEAATRACAVLQAALPLAAGAACTLAGALGASGELVDHGVPMLVWGTIVAAIVWWNRRHIPLTCSLLRVAAHGLRANPSLTHVSLALSLAGLLAATPLGWMGWVVSQNGELVANSSRYGDGECRDPLTGLAIDCCEFMPHPWVLAYLLLPLLSTALWTMLLGYQARVFIVGGATSQWYFSDPSSSTKGTTLRSLGHALGPQAGTVCAGALLTTLARMIWGLSEWLRSRRGCALLAIPLRLAVRLLELYSKFATIYAAISGEGLADAGRSVTALLKRTLLECWATTVWFAPFVVGMTSLLVSAAYGAAAGALFWLSQRSHPGADAELAKELGIAAGLACLFVTGFLAGVLLSVLDAAFICWAIDRDSNTISQREVYEAFAAVPLKTPAGGVVQGPDGGVAYGAALPPPPVAQRQTSDREPLLQMTAISSPC